MKKVLIALVLMLAVTGMVFANGAAEGAADNYPERSITLVVPAKTGGDMDQVSRILAAELTKELKVNVVVQNMGENGGNMGVQHVQNADADGYTFILFNGIYYTGLIAGKFPETMKDSFDIVCTAAKADTQILVVDAKSDITTPDAMAKKIKEQPNTVKFAATIGSPSQFHAVATENAMGGKFKKVDVASGSDKLVALLSGEVNVVSSTQSLVKDYVAQGRIAIVASICNERSSFYPDTKTFKESGYDLGPDFAATYMIMAKKGTPQNCVDKFSQAVANVMKNEESLKMFTNLSYAPAVRVGDEAKKWQQETFGLFEGMREAIKNDKW
ncbi:MAG: tripartite tricarboxylate transporter substrate binding protein [Spirochaetales bacterium]|nr:tripartite tricarboxylate transporter substrate binding protein [Spirochaetales bacterium]